MSTVKAELLSMYEKVQNAADKTLKGDELSKVEEDRAVAGLAVLKGLKVDTDVLVSTQVGKKVRKLTKHKSKKVADAASNVVEVWRKIVEEEASSSSPGVRKENGKSAVSDSPKPSVSENGSSKSESSSVKAKTIDLSKIPKTGEPSRDKFRQLLAAGLHLARAELADEHVELAQDKHIIKYSLEIEKELWNAFGGGRSDKDYKSKYRSISFNVKDPKNPDLRRKILFGDVLPSQLLTMTPEDMASDARKMEKGEIQKKMLFETTRGANATASTDQFRCGKCGQRKTTYYQLQTRSADEPMTTYVTCINCNNRWKFC